MLPIIVTLRSGHVQISSAHPIFATAPEVHPLLEHEAVLPKGSILIGWQPVCVALVVRDRVDETALDQDNAHERRYTPDEGCISIWGCSAAVETAA